MRQQLTPTVEFLPSVLKSSKIYMLTKFHLHLLQQSEMKASVISSKKLLQRRERVNSSEKCNAIGHTFLALAPASRDPNAAGLRASSANCFYLVGTFRPVTLGAREGHASAKRAVECIRIDRCLCHGVRWVLVAIFHNHYDSSQHEEILFKEGN